MKKIPYESKDVLICSCNSDEHQYLIYYSDNESPNGQVSPTVHIHPYLITHKSFWKRVVVGIKYMFGYKTKYGHWDEFMFDPSDADKLQDVVDYLRKIKK